MRKITPELTGELQYHISKQGIKNPGKGKPYYIKSFTDMVKQVAMLSYLNMNYLLFFRGQSRDYKNKEDSSTFYPTIYRGEKVSQKELDFKFGLLDNSEEQLSDSFKRQNLIGKTEILRKKFIRWSILQHYDVCDTPLLDFTHSIRVACTFAQNSKLPNGFVYIFGLPYITNRITINSEEDIVLVRLISISPPDALRPYFQNGYLAGTDDITNKYESKVELDFKNRLIAKFMIPNSNRFWGSEFNKLPYEILFPQNDKIKELCDNIKPFVKSIKSSNILAKYLNYWKDLERLLTNWARSIQTTGSLSQALSTLVSNNQIDKKTNLLLNDLRRSRNRIIHDTEFNLDSSKNVDLIQKDIKQIKDLFIKLNKKWNKTIINDLEKYHG